MPRVSKIRNRTEEFDVEIGTDHVKGHYYPSRMTPKDVDDLVKLSQSDDLQAGDMMAETACKIIADWDLLDDEDGVIPMEKEAVYLNVPNDVLVTIIKKIRENQAPGKPSSGDSSGSF